jgi:hypothetical protein
LPFSKEQHLQRAADNEAFAKGIDLSVPNNIGWHITATFYAAVHYIQAYLSSHGKYPVLHTARDAAISKDHRISGVFPDYRELKDKSREARYECSILTRQDAQEMQGCLSAIKSATQGHMGNK